MNLSFDNTHFQSDGTPLLGPITAQIPLNGITCVLGYNGAGKSLFLELCHGMLEPTMGSISWDGVSALNSRKQRGYIFQHRILLRRSVRKNIALPLQATGWAKAAIQARVDEMLELARLTAKADDPAAILSGGEAQRMALVRALAPRPKVVIMDEPTSSLDPSATTKFEKMIEDVALTGVKFIWATHNVNQAQRFANDIVFINDGKILEHGNAKDFFTAPQTETAKNYVMGQ